MVFEDQSATVVSVGGGVRRYDVGDRQVLHPYAENAMCDGAHGTPLVPWPNRLADGRYVFDGVEHQVALTEPEKHNAIHGLLRWQRWDLRDRDGASVTLSTSVVPQTGYPFALDVSVTYALAKDGLTVTLTATNVGETACPYACGQHPYLSPGEGLVDDCSLQLDARTRILTDAERQLPTGLEDVQGSAFDFRAGHQLGGLQVDHAFTDLARDDLGRAWARLHRPDAATAQLWADESFPVIEVYTADTLAPARRRRGLGVEPMTIAPNAFRTGTGVNRLEPGATTRSSWGAQLVTGRS